MSHSNPVARDRSRVLLALLVLLLATGCSAVRDATAVVRPNTMTVTALLADSAGLFEGNDVGVLGVPVGTVTSIEPAGAHVRVEMEIDADRPVPADAGAVVVARSVATDRYVELTPVWREGPRLADGDTIALERTRTPVDFDAVLAAIDDFATGIAGSQETTDAIGRFLDEGTATLRGRGPLLRRGIGSLGRAVDSVAGQREEVVATVESLDRLLATVAANDETTRRFVRQVSRASRLLADERFAFRRTLRALDRAVTTVARFAVDNRERIRRTLDDATAVTRTVLSRRTQLREILEVMPLMLQNLARAADGERLSVRIDPAVLLPLSDQVTAICESLPLDLCAQVGTEPPALEPVLEALLGGGRR
jgi:phospholipid/cholesterol/gamma-HCH transport system substrate-binding protein